MYTNEKLIDKAKQNNNVITIKDIEKLKLTEIEYDELLEYLEKNNIQIDDIDEEMLDIATNYKEKKDSLTIYFNEILAYKTLSRNEEKQLFLEYKNGSKTAKDKIIKCNLKLVVSIAKKYTMLISTMRISFSDLISEGNLGLMKAIEKFDTEKGFKFSTYATWWIKQYINRYIENTSNIIRIPVHLHEKISKLSKFNNMYYKKNGKMPSLQECCDELKISSEGLTFIRWAQQEVLSLDEPVNQDEESSPLIDFVSSDESDNVSMVDSIFYEDLIEKVKVILNESEFTLLCHRFGLMGFSPKTLEEIGKLRGITRERVRQLEAKALNKVRLKLKSQEERQKIKKRGTF